MKKIKFITVSIIIALTLSLVVPSVMPNTFQQSTVNAAKMKISKKKVTLKKGQKTTLKILRGKKKIKKVKWTSSNKKVATVSSSGKVTAKGKGTATITGKVGKKKYKCKVMVTVPKTPTQTTFKIGQTWTVSGQWSITINSVTETSDRNPYSDYNPEAVYIIDYTYKNLGVKNGLYVDLEFSTIIDSAKFAGYSYPGDITYYPKEIPVGSSCKAQACVGVDHKGNFKIYYSTYDNNFVERKAIFDVTVN